ncbi:MAG TPA: hypothetical protein VKF42_11490 [Chitinivibrionales bacterium]|nr:hypothetical protein [Chitinivibrionales bacterium]
MKLPPGTNRFAIVFGATVFSTLILWVDLEAGPFIRLPILFALPVIAVSWYGGLVAGESLAIGLLLVRLLLEANIPKPWMFEDSIINTAILLLTLSLISFLVYYTNRQRMRIKILQGFLPICSFCKRIRTKEGKWEQMESYITRHSQAEFSHGLCPQCTEKHYGKILREGHTQERVQENSGAHHLT